MAAPASEDECFSFNPSSDLLVDRYLRAKIDGKLSHLANAAYFVDADVCSARPEELVRRHSLPARVPPRDAPDGQQFYFFSPARFVDIKLKSRRSRTIDGSGGKESWHAEGSPKPVEGSAAAGFMTKFSFHVRIGPKITEKPGWIMTEYTLKDIKEGDTVLCKVYRSPRGPGKSCKRKATDDLEAPTPSTRQRQISEAEDDVTLFAGDIERCLMSVQEEDHSAAPEIQETHNNMEEASQPEPTPTTQPRMMIDQDDDADFALEIERHLHSVEDHAPAPEIVEETQSVQQIQPEPQMVQATLDGDMAFVDEMLNLEVDEVPGEDFEAFHTSFWGSLLDDTEQRDAAKQSVQDHAAAPEFGETLQVEEIQPSLQYEPPSFGGDSSLQINEGEHNVMLFAGDIERSVQEEDQLQAQPEMQNVEEVGQPLPEPQIMVPTSFDFEDFEAYDETFWAGITYDQDVGLIGEI